MKVLLYVLLSLSVLLNIFVLGFYQKEPVIKYEIPQSEMQNIRRVAVLCGIDKSKAERMSVNETLSDIESFLNGAESCPAPVLAPDELTLLESYLNTRKTILAKIKQQNSFIAGLNGHPVLTLSTQEK